MDAGDFLRSVGGEVQAAFAEQRSILSFEEYLDLFHKAPRLQARNSAQWLRDAIEHFGTRQVQTPAGPVRRWRLFDLEFAPEAAARRVAGHEEVQAAVVRILGNFVRSGRVNKLILLHGPNGSAKSSIVAALVAAMEAYSRLPEGALYRFHWVFPSEKRVRGGGTVGFGGGRGAGEAATFAHLEGEAIDARLACPLKDHPLLLVPRPQRRRLLEEHCRPAVKGKAGEGDFVLSDAISSGELCHFCHQIHDALLASYGGDYAKVLRHVQVERYYVSGRYQEGAVAVEQPRALDAVLDVHREDPAGMPPALKPLWLLAPRGPLANANRGLVAFDDFVTADLNYGKHLLPLAEHGAVALPYFGVELDAVMLASVNEDLLSGYDVVQGGGRGKELAHRPGLKDLKDFPYLKARSDLVRVPYLRSRSAERDIYQQQVTPEAVGKHIAPHATEVAALWGVLTRLKKPQPGRYPPEIRAVIDGLSPLEKLRLYDRGEAPDRLGLAVAKELKARLEEIFRESDVYDFYEGRTGASAREIKTAIFNAAQNPRWRCLTPVAVLEELEALCRDKSVHEFLQQEVVDGYHDHESFVRAAEGEYLDALDEEIRDSMGMVSEAQHQERFDRYLGQVSSWVKGERIRNRVTGEYEQPDEERMAEFERTVMPPGDDRAGFRRSVIAAIGAYRVDHPEGSIDTAAIFPDLFKRLRDHYFEERRRELQRSKENLLRYLSDERAGLDERSRRHVERALATLRDRYGYCEHCAKDAVLFLLRRRYED